MAKCLKCGSAIVIRQRKEGGGFFLSCRGYPDCKECLWFPQAVKEVASSNETCPKVNFLIYWGITLFKYVVKNNIYSLNTELRIWISFNERRLANFCS